MIQNKVTVLCPTCQNSTSMEASNVYRPFCCERCKLIDLGAWASEEYKIPTASNNTQEWEEKEGD